MDAGKEAERILEDYLKLKNSFWSVPYDPNNFICDRRMKKKLSPYLHHRILEIENFSNMDEWMEGTLIEQDSEQVSVENGQVQKPGNGPFSVGASQQKL